ncbi:hypothetical protein DT256_12245 [Lactiplantibacillus plantarum]|nr:hypothetical protein DT256_12245 [Lactiplantibacillus plantarum]
MNNDGGHNVLTALMIKIKLFLYLLNNFINSTDWFTEVQKDMYIPHEYYVIPLNHATHHRFH